VTRDGEQYANIITYAGNSNVNLSNKITANGAKCDITLNGKTVGNFVFNKNSPYIEISLTDNVAVDVTWNCASKYASCILKDAGVYALPQLLHDNGKPQSFNAIWISSVTAITDSIVAYGAEAQDFSSMILETFALDPRNSLFQPEVLVLSDVSAVNSRSVATSMANGVMLVAINLPENNGLIAVPTIQEDHTTTKRVVSEDLERSTEEVVVSQSSQEIIPPYWIVVTKQSTPSLTARCVALNNDDYDEEQAREVVTQFALEIINSARFPDSGSSSRGGEIITGGEHWILRDEVSDNVAFGANFNNKYQARHKIWQLNGKNSFTNKEYWQVETWLNSYMGNYETSLTHCGPYLDSRVTMVGCNQNADPSQWPLYAFGPSTTAESAQASIGFSFSVDTGGAAGVSLSYSKTWDMPGVRYDVGTESKWINWVEGFRGTDHPWWSGGYWYDEPCSAAYGAFESTRRVVFQRDVGSGITLYLSDTFNIIDENAIWWGDLFWFKEDYNWSFTWAYLPYASIF
jgi:hypothetical protein